MQPPRGGSEQRQTPDQDNARGRVGADDRGYAADRGAEALTDEARN